MKHPLKIESPYEPTGDQPEAIAQLVKGLNSGQQYQTLLGVTGSGKTFTIAKTIEKVQRPTLILSHNKTLAAQLYNEFKNFFPDNAVEYFVSYYDYYQPEAYLPVTDTYIEKDLAINSEIEKLRISTTSSLLSGRSDVIVISSVSCIYGMGNPEELENGTITVKVGDKIDRNVFLRQLVTSLYSRNEVEFKHGTFRVHGDTVDIFMADADFAYRVIFFGDEIEEIVSIDPFKGNTLEAYDKAVIYPASLFMVSKDKMEDSITTIQDDMMERVDYFKEVGQPLEAKRIHDRVNYDIEMMRELGYCPGIENYSRYFDGRKKGMRPFCLLDYFPDDFMLVIDESHVTIPQVHAMYGGDRSRKMNLVEYGFRLPAAMDNRPLQFKEFEEMIGQTIYVSATPANYELEKCEGVYIEQVIRPTGLLDPPIEIRPTLNQIDNLMEEIRQITEKKERTLVTTLTKRMAEELNTFLGRNGVKCNYIHSDVDTLDRVKILEQLREGTFDVLIGVNLLREGLDLPEVSLVAILDADKEGFLRSERSLTQTSGRAARNVNGKVIMYADKITGSMQRTMDNTTRRREKQLAYNEKHGITPQQINKAKGSMLGDKNNVGNAYYEDLSGANLAADPVTKYMARPELEAAIKRSKDQMLKASKKLEYIDAAMYRDEMQSYQKLLKDLG
jgi:excinuclease ABC subunit B